MSVHFIDKYKCTSETDLVFCPHSPSPLPHSFSRDQEELYQLRYRQAGSAVECDWRWTEKQGRSGLLAYLLTFLDAHKYIEPHN